MTRPHTKTLVATALLASLSGLGCHSSDNVSWFVVSNPSGDPNDPNNPNSGGGTVGIIKTAQTLPPQQGPSQKGQLPGSADKDAAAGTDQVLPRYVEQFMGATRLALEGRHDVDLGSLLLEQAQIALREDADADADAQAASLPVIEILERLESLEPDSEFPEYERARQAAASLRMSLATINLLLALEEPNSPLADLAPIPSALPMADPLEDFDTVTGERVLREEFVMAARVQIRAARANYAAAHSDRQPDATAFLVWVEGLAEVFSL